MTTFQLREIKEQDLPLILKWRNSERIKHSMYSNEIITWEQHVSWFQRVLQDTDREVFLFLQADTPLGLIQFYDMDRQHERCYWGFYIGEEKAPKGAGTKMARLAIHYIFQKGFRKICAEVLETNMTSLRFHQKLDFQIEGTFQKHIKKNDQLYDVIIMALFNKNKKRKEEANVRNMDRK